MNTVWVLIGLLFGGARRPARKYGRLPDTGRLHRRREEADGQRSRRDEQHSTRAGREMRAHEGSDPDMTRFLHVFHIACIYALPALWPTGIV
jgi:hypothetical protein